MACNTCKGYYQFGCDILKMKEELRHLQDKVELLQYKIKDRVSQFNEVNEGHASMTA